MGTPSSTEISLPILGMNCTGCASNVERAIGKLPGVSAVKVDLKANAANVTYDPLIVDLVEFQYAITQIGYEIPSEEITLTIEGMSCVSCSSHVGSALSDLTGVLQATVNLDKATAKVTYVPQLVTLDQMEQAVARAGYGAKAQAAAESAGSLGLPQAPETIDSTSAEKLTWRFKSLLGKRN